MRISELRNRFSSRLAEFVWGQWSQMGISAAPTRSDAWAVDPEALLLLTLEVGRDEPRLFEEVFDWVVVNERLLSVRRLRNLCVDDSDRALVGATVAAAGRLRKRARFQGGQPPERQDPPEPFYRRLSPPSGEPDPAFLEFGFVKSPAAPQRRSAAPEMLAPINFAFRLRSLLGIGARAEVVRVLLGGQAPRYSVAAITESTGYAKRNVQEAVAGLHAAGVVTATTVGNEQRIAIPLERWAALLELERLPEHLDWPQTFAALRLLLRWLADPTNEELTEYMLASEARLLLESLGPDLRFAGIPVDLMGPPGADYWPHFVQFVEGLRLPR